MSRRLRQATTTVTGAQGTPGVGTLRRLGVFLLLLHRGDASRYWEIDALRGLAIIMMVIFHTVFDLSLFGYHLGEFPFGPWRILAIVTAGLFASLGGLSLALSHSRAGRQARGWSDYRRYLGRGLKLLGWGMSITIAAWASMGQPLIIFGILHMLGTATILAYPFLFFRRANLVIAAAIIFLGLYLNQVAVSFPWLLPLGLRPPTLPQSDWVPLLPWFGVVLLGVSAGQLLYPGGVRRFTLSSLGTGKGIRELAWLGRHSLMIYLIHQPFLIVTLTLMDVIGLV